MSFVDLKYINLCSPQLEKFKHKSNDLWNFRCPICGDSKKHKNKARGFIYKKKVDYFYRCHNCEYSTTFKRFLEKVNINLYAEYISEKFISKNKPKEPPYLKKYSFKPKFNKAFYNLPSFISLDDNHPAKQYLIKRKIPTKFFGKLFLTANFKKFTNTVIPNKFKDTKQDEPRLVIPFYDKDNNVIGFQGRSFDPKSKMKYITIKMDNVEHLIYGSERLDETKPKYCVEGPFDSLFIDNFLAMGGIKFNILPSNVVMVLDNEKRNTEITNSMKKYIDIGHSIVIWPDSIEGKDINEMIMNGMTGEEIKSVIDTNTYSSLEANFKLARWRK